MTNNIQFKSSEIVFSKVRRFLKSFDFAGLIDEGEFPTYVKEVLNNLGIGVFKEQRAILTVKDGKACLPGNFKFYQAAFKCEVDEFAWRDKQNSAHLQSSLSFERDVTQDFYLDYNDCQISCNEGSRSIIESINIKSTVYSKADATFNRIIPLNITKHIDRELLASEEVYLKEGGLYSISFDKNNVYTNFKEGIIYIEYFGLPINEGELEYPDIHWVEKAIEWYIIYQILLSFMFNSSVPDIMNKVQKAEIEYNNAISESKYYLKMPSFQTSINAIRRKRTSSALNFFTSNYRGTNFQRAY